MRTIKAVILVIEDEPQMRRLLRNSLEPHGYTVIETELGADGIVAARTQNPDVILLDLGLPDIGGLEVVRALRKELQTPILILSARGQEEDKIQALDEGAHDYLTKPFAVGELLARIRVALRLGTRSSERDEAKYASGDLEVDFARHIVTVHGSEVHLTPTEYKLLVAFVKSGGGVLTHRTLIREGWGSAYETQSQSLRVYVRQLRQKLGDDLTNPKYILNEPGVGYRWLA